MNRALKHLIFGLLGKDPAGVVVTFLSGEDTLCRAMADEVRALVPDRMHLTAGIGRGDINLDSAPAGELWLQLRRALRGRRIALAPVLFDGSRSHRPLRLAAAAFAPRKILAYNQRLERHHLKLRTAVASLLFMRGVPLDRIFLRPRFWPGRREHSVFPREHRIVEGRPFDPHRRKVAVLTPYLPYPLSHGGAVRIYNLLRETARDFDIVLFSFVERFDTRDETPLCEFCSRIVLVPASRYREPRWASLAPPEVLEWDSLEMRRLLRQLSAEWKTEALQVEYTQMGVYGGDILVEHDVTFDLKSQVHERQARLSTWWDMWRWRRFERQTTRRFPYVVTMSAKDAALLPWANTHVIPNGVDLARFQPERESPGVRILFVGSFRHFPNVIGFQWLVEEVWPLMLERSPEARIVVVAGPDAWTHWREHTRKAVPELHPSIEVLHFVSDMRPLYRDANLVVVPTQVSAGTNLKVLEAMATRRALVSTASGVAGLGLRHGVHAWIANSADEFATAIALLLEHSHVRTQMAERAYSLLKDEYSWDVIGERQRHLFRTAIESRWPSKKVRPAAAKDLEAIDRIQKECPEAAQWPPYSYLPYRVLVAEMGRAVAGFIVCRQVADKEIEILNLAVAPQFRRRGVGTALLQESMKRWPGEYFLEVRESNLAAQQLYARLCFRPVGARPGYYENPPEAAVVMRLS